MLTTATTTTAMTMMRRQPLVAQQQQQLTTALIRHSTSRSIVSQHGNFYNKNMTPTTSTATPSTTTTNIFTRYKSTKTITTSAATSASAATSSNKATVPAWLLGDDEDDLDHLCQKHMDLSEQEFAMGCSFLHQIALGMPSSKLESILQDLPRLIDFRDYDRRTPLHIAASEGHLELCKILIQKGAKINRSDRWGNSALG